MSCFLWGGDRLTAGGVAATFDTMTWTPIIPCTVLLEAVKAEGCKRARMRELSVRRKLNAMPAVFAGKRVLLVDDSIVRGTTMSQIVDMVRRAGASKVRLSQ